MNQPLQVGSEGELLFSSEENELYALHNTEVELLFKGEKIGVFHKKYKLLDNYFYGFPRLSIREFLIKTLNNKK